MTLTCARCGGMGIVYCSPGRMMDRSPSVLRGTFHAAFLAVIVLGPGSLVDLLGTGAVFVLPLLPHLAIGLRGRVPGTKGVPPRRHVLQVGHLGKGELRVEAVTQLTAVVTQQAKDHFGQRYESDHVDYRHEPQGEECQLP